MIPSMTSRNTLASSRSTKALGDEGAEHQRGAGDQALERDIWCQRAEALKGHGFA